jgi:hypothetical protein
MSQDTNDQASTNSTSLNDYKEEEDEDMIAIESIQADLDTLIWDNQEEKELQMTRREGYRMISNPRSFKTQLFNKAGTKFESMIAKCFQVLNEIDMMILGKEIDPNKLSDKLLNQLQEDVGSTDIQQMAMKADKTREYLEQRKRHDILYTNEKRSAVLDGIAESIGADDLDNNNARHNNQARKTNSEDDLTGSRAKNDSQWAPLQHSCR